MRQKKVCLGITVLAVFIACTRGIEEFTDVAHWLPWQCLDLTYIYTLLHDGYSFSDDQELHVSQTLFLSNPVLIPSSFQLRAGSADQMPRETADVAMTFLIVWKVETM